MEMICVFLTHALTLIHYKFWRKRMSSSLKHLKSLISLRSLISSIVVSSAMTSVVATASSETPTIINSTQSAQALPGFSQKYRPAPTGKAIPNQYIVVLKNEVVSQAMSGLAATSSMSAMQISQQTVNSMSSNMAGAYGVQVTQNYFATMKGFVGKMSRFSAENLMMDDRVAYIEEDQTMSINTTQFNATWGLDRVDQANLPLNSEYTYNFDGSGVDSYVIDTGVLASHSDLGGRVTNGYTAINDGRGSTDCNGHGTHVAGTMGSDTYGVAKNTTLIPVRVLDCNGSGSNSGVIAGVDWVAQVASGPSVANMSLGGGSSSALDNAVNAAINKGITFVVAAGNSNSNACSGSPNRVPNALTIASSTSNDSRSSFSSWGSCVDMFAPGSSITSTWSNGGTRTISGTSMASPHVAGVVALYLDANPSASPSQVENALESVAAVGKISNPNGSPNLLVQSLFGGPNPTPQPTPTPTPQPGDNVLVNGTPVALPGVSTGDDIIYTMDVPSGATDISFSIAGGSGDADLYVRFGAAPTNSTYDCRPYRNGNNESCTGSETGGTYYVRVRAYSAFSGVTLNGSYTTSTGSTPVDETINDISIAQGAWGRYILNLDPGYSNLTITTSGGSGDVDLYVNFGSQSTTGSYDCRPYRNGNNETCTFTSPQSGAWHIDLRGYSAASGVTLKVTAD